MALWGIPLGFEFIKESDDGSFRKIAWTGVIKKRGVDGLTSEERLKTNWIECEAPNTAQSFDHGVVVGHDA